MCVKYHKSLQIFVHLVAVKVTAQKVVFKAETLTHQRIPRVIDISSFDFGF